MSPFTFSPFISSRIKYLDRVSVTFLFLFPHSDAWTSCHFSKEGHIWLTSKSRCWPWWAAGAGFNPCISSYTFFHNIQFLAVQMPLSFQRCTHGLNSQEEKFLSILGDMEPDHDPRLSIPRWRWQPFLIQPDVYLSVPPRKYFTKSFLNLSFTS